MREMQALVRNYVLNRDRQMKYLAVLIALSLFVSFMVPFILMQPADSMAEASACGIEEHVHTEEAGCYQLFCAPEEGEEHVHSERCYALICEKIVHTHTPNCYPTKPDFSALFSTIYDPENLKATADGQSYANSPKDKPSEYKAPAGSILGVATHFHIFAESVSLQSHVHGNIATNWLLQNGAFGVYNDRLNGMSSINYIRNLGPNANLDNAYQTQLIMGSDYSSPPSFWFSNRYEIRSKKDRKTYYIPKDKFPMWFAPEYVQPQVKFEKKDRPFINITQELDKFAEMSMDLVEEANKQTYGNNVVVKEEGEKLILDFSNVTDKYIYYTINATKFGMDAPWSSWMKVLEIKGITEDKFLFLNIDVGTNPDAYFSKSWMVYKDDGTTYGTGEVPLEDGGCRVIYNIVSSDGNGGNYKPFEGKAVFGERRNGSILAPNADVNVAGNTNGTIIARNFVATGESHRCDIQQEGTEGDDADWSLGEETPTTPKQQKLEITVKKNWSGGTSYNGVKVVLYKSKSPTLTDPHKVPGKEATLSSDNDWQTVFTDLPAYEAEEKLYYFVKEETEVSGFTATYENNMISVNSGTITITNVAKKKINVSVEKKWEHENGTTTAVTVNLYQTTNANLDATKPEQFSGMTVYATATLSEGNWNCTFSELPELSDDGQKYYYYIVEQNVPANYAAGYTGNGVHSNDGTVTVTNTKDKMVSVTAKKEWKPTAPGSVVTVKVNLYQSTNGSLDATKASDFSSLTPLKTATLTAYNNWTYQFPEYPAMDASGNKYYYYIVEQDAPSGYSTIYTNNGITSDSGEVLITNVKDITVTAKKIWDPDTVASAPTTQETKTYKIMPIGDSLTEGYSERLQWGNHGYRKYLDYFLKDKSYEIDMVGPEGSDTNTAEFPVGNEWITYAYDNNHAGYSGYEIAGVLDKLVEKDSVKNAQPDIVLLTIGTNNMNNNHSVANCEPQLRELIDHILANLPSGSMLFLTSIPEFKHNYGNNDYVDVTEYNAMVERVAQSYANSLKNVRFVDENKWVTLDDLVQATNDWIHPTDAGYEKIGREWATVIDSYIQELQPVSSVPAETREPINVRLYKSTNPYLDAEKQTDVEQMTYVQDATLNSDNGWTGKFEGLPAMENGSTLYYYIVEKDVPKHYTVTYSNNAVNNNDGTVVVTNTKEKMLNITLDKEWVGGKPDKEDITVTLYQSTERNLDMTVSDSEFQQLLTDGKLWEYKDEKNTDNSSETFTAGETPHFTNLPVYDENGTMYYYYVRESDVSGYKPSYSKNPVYGADKVVTITNTKTISVSVTKNWKDQYNNTQTNNQTVTINLYKYKHIPAEGEMSYWPTTYMPVGSVLVSSQDIYQNDTATFGDLPVEENGYKLFYYIEEIVKDENTAKKYDTIYGTDGNGQLADPNQTATYGKTVINKEKDENKISISVKKKWDVSDYWNDDGDGVIEPPNEYYVQDSVNPPEAWADPIKVTLQYSYDGTTWTNYSADCTDVEFYTNHTFMNLPKQINGQNVRYKIVESYNYGYVTDYGDNNNIEASTITKDTATPVIELKNTLLKRTLNVKKNWYNNIDEGVDKVVVEVYRRTSTKKPDLGIGEDGTISGGNGGNTGGDTDTVILQGMFENGSNDGWTLTGSHSSDTLTSGVVSSTSWDASNDSGPGAYMVYIHGLIEYTNQDVLSKLASGNTYSISAQATRPYYSKIVVNYSDGTSETFTFTDKSQNTAWTDISAEFTVPSGKTVSSLQVGINHDGGLWGDPLCIDDVKVELVSTGSGSTEQPTEAPTQAPTQAPTNPPSEDVPVVNSWTFEQDGSQYSWGVYGNGGDSSSASRNNASAAEGSYCFEMSIKSANSGINTYQGNLVSQGVYKLSAQVSRGASSAAAKVYLKFESGGQTIDIASCDAPTWGWKEVSGTFTVPMYQTGGSLYIITEASDGTLAVDNIQLTGPYPSSNSKPRNVETFFSGSNTLTKRKLNIQKMETVKLAKATNEYKTINVTIPKSSYTVKTDDEGNYVPDDNGNLQFTINPFTLASASDLAFMVGAKLSHLEVHFREGGDHFNFPGDAPTNTNIYIANPRFWSWEHKPNGDKTIHTFKAAGDYTITAETVLMSQTPINPENIERVILKCTDGSMLVINNVKTVTGTDNYGSFNVNPNYTKNITLKQWTNSNGSFELGWDLGSTELSRNEVWSGQSLTSIDVYFNENTVDSNTLTTDNSNMKNAMDTNNNLSSPATDWQKNANISQYAMYLMLNHVKDASWFGTELVSTGISTETQNGMTVAHYDIPDTTLTNGLENTLVMMTTMPENVKAIVVNAGNGQKYELINTTYTPPTTTTPVEHSVSSEKWYPILNSTNNSDSVNNYDVLLSPVELYGEHGGKVIDRVEVTTRMHTSGVTCQTYINNGGTGENKLTGTSWKGNVKTYDGNNTVVADGNRLIFRANAEEANPTEKINKVVVYFKDGTSYTIHNMNFVEYDPLKKEHQTGFNSVDSSTNLLQTAGTQYTDYADKYLNYIIVNYGNVTAQPQDKLVVNGTQYSGTPVDGNNSVIRYNVTSGSFDATGLNITTLNLVNDSGDGMDINYIKDIVMYYDTDTENDTGTGLEWWSTYTITNTDFSDYVPPEGKIHNGHETSFKQYGTSQLLNNSSTYRGYSTKSAEYVIVKYGEDGDEFVSIPRDLISLNDNQGSPTIDVDGDVTMKHTFTNSITNASVLKIIEDASDNATLADIKELTIYYTDGSTYTVKNTDYSPKVEPDVPAIGNQPALGSDFVFIDTLELTKDPETGEWIGSLEGLPVTDGQGNAYEYVIVEKAVYGKDADKYQLVSYEHPDGVILEKDGTQTSFLNTTTDDENGLVIMPSSGGEGKTWFYVAGVALMLCGIAGCYGMKRRQRSRR